jgi:hypothetical protein
MVKGLANSRLPLPHSAEDRLWLYKSYPQEDLELIDEFLHGPPQSFKLFGEFMINIQNMAAKFGVCYNPQLDAQFGLKKTLEDEIFTQWTKRETLEREALEADTKKKKIVKKPPPKRGRNKKPEIPQEPPLKLTSIQFKYTRVDIITLKLVFWATNDKSMIRLLKFWDCHLTPSEISSIIALLEIPRNVIDKLFIFYNELHLPKIYIDLVKPELKLQMLTLYKCGLGDPEAIEMFELIKGSTDLVSIDLFWNNLTDLLVDKISETLGEYRRLEYIGLGKNRLKSVGSIKGMFERIGRWDLSNQGFEEYEEMVRGRDQIVEKNKKLRA